MPHFPDFPDNSTDREDSIGAFEKRRDSTHPRTAFLGMVVRLGLVLGLAYVIQASLPWLAE
ncbi:hypothetical protein [Sinorhizobium chiapasense]|uniref:Transmembrane protein n=1 Tax=Sinorhizobium chiapasense TaxID=501572 RepID=A0ABZ2BA00_9HYPH